MWQEKSRYGRLQAHGALMVGYMSTASTYVIAHTREGADETPVSLGYDRIRFLAPVYFGDTVTVEYRISAIDPERCFLAQGLVCLGWRSSRGRRAGSVWQSRG